MQLLFSCSCSFHAVAHSIAIPLSTCSAQALTHPGEHPVFSFVASLNASDATAVASLSPSGDGSTHSSANDKASMKASHTFSHVSNNAGSHSDSHTSNHTSNHHVNHTNHHSNHTAKAHHHGESHYHGREPQQKGGPATGATAAGVGNTAGGERRVRARGERGSPRAPAVMQILRLESLQRSHTERLAAAGEGWATQCRGDSAAAPPTASGGCAEERFDIRRHSKA